MRPQRYLTRMVLFVVLAIAIALLLLPTLQTAFAANPFLNSLILAVLALGIVYIFRQVLMLRPEAAWLHAYQQNKPAALGGAEPVLLGPMARMLGERKGRLSLS